MDECLEDGTTDTALENLRNGSATTGKLCGVSSQYKKVYGRAALRYGDLPGVQKDLRILQGLLKQKYNYKDITILVDSDKVSPSSDCWLSEKNMCSRAAKLKAMHELIANTQSGDHIVFSFSGHGDQVVPIKDKNERDGKDEILIPADYTVDKHSKLSHFIRDDTIREIFVDQLPEGVHCTLIFDCCHSGTACDLPDVGDEDEDDGKVSRPRSKAPGFSKKETLHHEHAANAKARTPNYRPFLVKQVTSWSACSDNQQTFGNPKGGLFIKVGLLAMAFVDILRGTNSEIMHGDFLLHLQERLVKDATDNLKPKIHDTPRPQLGSLYPEHILDAVFTL
ncbi:hypothetical protein V8D89_012970 [Ganoderma adspersum]